ncbi:hypothetical protein KQI86_02480 [Clostridium sp. MSJ-11]|uniref:Secreted protein n=1 Tax=Clostridium mobile TaxID=2841512 RepID=A0ABS6EEQ1_9CLOT|nr:hypothetical protein [Clostridium mobile]MBU5483176.1 hypothetical protein [Clostridium mobile]
MVKRKKVVALILTISLISIGTVSINNVIAKQLGSNKNNSSIMCYDPHPKIYKDSSIICYDPHPKLYDDSLMMSYDPHPKLYDDSSMMCYDPHPKIYKDIL